MAISLQIYMYVYLLIYMWFLQNLLFCHTYWNMYIETYKQLNKINIEHRNIFLETYN